MISQYAGTVRGVKGIQVRKFLQTLPQRCAAKTATIDVEIFEAL